MAGPEARLCCSTCMLPMATARFQPPSWSTEEASTKAANRPMSFRLFEPLAKAGFAWFSIDYRMAPRFRFPQAIEDVYTAVRWLKANAADYRIDSSKIVLIGESAGGFLVNYAGTHAQHDASVAAVVDFYSPVEYPKLAAERRDHPERFNMASSRKHLANHGSAAFFGVEQIDEAGLRKLREIPPLYAVHKGRPPSLAIHGTNDDQVSYDQSPMLCDAMHQAGVRL
jgi:acetyl esterase